jgi:hypothetical protein
LATVARVSPCGACVVAPANTLLTWVLDPASAKSHAEVQSPSHLLLENTTKSIVRDTIKQGREGVMGVGSTTEQKAAWRTKRKQVEEDRSNINVRVKRYRAKKKDEEGKAAKTALERERKRNLRKRKKAAEEEAGAEEENQSTGNDVEMQDSATSTLPVSDDEVTEKVLQDFKNMLKDMKQSFERVKSEAKKHYIEMTSADEDGEWHRAPVCDVCV